MKIDIPADIYADIAELIGSEASPVGIDAKKTHIIILHKLIDIDCRLARLEGERRGLNADVRQDLGVTGDVWRRDSYATERHRYKCDQKR